MQADRRRLRARRRNHAQAGLGVEGCGLRVTGTCREGDEGKEAQQRLSQHLDVWCRVSLPTAAYLVPTADLECKELLGAGWQKTRANAG